jgi:starvation-inducible DNA-binding protein
MKNTLGIMDKNRQAVANELSIILADEYVLYTKTKNAHWNIEGEDFFDKHQFFETQFNELDEIVDNVAERIRSLGHYAEATLKSFLALTHLSEVREDRTSSQSYIEGLLADHETIIVHLIKNIQHFSNEYHDLGTSDFITGLMEKHEKMAWFLRSHLNK